MVRMRVTSVEGRYLVKMDGSLTSRNLRRLEHLCGPALEQRPLPLTLHFSVSSSLDDTARAYVDRLVQRGAVLVFDS